MAIDGSLLTVTQKERVLKVHKGTIIKFQLENIAAYVRAVIYIHLLKRNTRKLVIELTDNLIIKNSSERHMYQYLFVIYSMAYLTIAICIVNRETVFKRLFCLLNRFYWMEGIRDWCISRQLW